MPRIRVFALIVSDLALIFLSYLAASLLLRTYGVIFDIPLDVFLFEERGLLQLCLTTLLVILSLYWYGLYNQIRVRSRRVLFENLLLVFGTVFLFQALISYSRTDLFASRWIMVAGSSISFFSILFWRILYGFIMVRLLEPQRVLFWADTKLSRTIAQHIFEHPEKGYTVIGVVAINQPSPDPSLETPPNYPIYSLAEFREKLPNLVLDRISVSTEIQSSDASVSLLLNLSMRGISVESVADIYEDLFQQIPLDTITSNQLIFSPSLRPSPWALTLKMIYDPLLAIIAILFTWPLMILTAIAVRLDSPGPAILRQKRVGRNGEVFEILKFRSMYMDADKRFGSVRADFGDPRITRVGRYIRRLRFDELPQFFNVLKGEMSIVGPRPEMPIHIERITQSLPLYTQRERVKPGITGWAQLHHKPELTMEETAQKIQYDLYYIKYFSPALDFIIMFHTVRTIVFRIGAR